MAGDRGQPRRDRVLQESVIHRAEVARERSEQAPGRKPHDGHTDSPLRRSSSHGDAPAGIAPGPLALITWINPAPPPAFQLGCKFSGQQEPLTRPG